MTPPSSTYRNWTFKSLLVIVYLFFFAAQINGRFYSAANFFVYGKGPVVSQDAGGNFDPGTAAPDDGRGRVPCGGRLADGSFCHGCSGAVMIGKGGLQHGKAHLSVDKRYHGRGEIKALPCNDIVLLVVRGIRLRTRYSSYDEAVIRTDPPILSLRGPPVV